MSLVVWLPLNGNLENQGLSNTVASINGTVAVDSAGKIGKCYSFSGGTNCLIVNYGKNIPANNLSISCWAYVVANSHNKIIFGVANGSNQRLYVGIQSDYYQLAYGAQSWGSTPNIAKATIGEWHHIAVSIDNNVCSMYYDGKFIHSISQTAFNLASDIMIGGRADGYTGSVKINDFRIYDHALSAKEVKELAKGLVLHYRLAGPGQENLVKNSSQKIISGDYAVTSYELSEALVLNQTYTITMKAKLTTDLKWIGIWSDGGNTMFAGCQARNENNFYKWTVTCNSSSATHNIFTIFASNNDVGVMQGNTPKTGTCEIEWIKLEKGSVATPWCPNPADALYSTMGYNNNIEYDCSGYRRNGTKSGIITWDIDSPRYTTSYKWPAATSAANRIISPSCTFDGKGITMAVWVKFTGTTAGGGNYHMPLESSSPGYYEMSVDTSGRLRAGIYVNGNRYVENCANPSMYDNKWHHIAITYNGSKICRYVDGKAYVETNVAGTANGLEQAFYIGSYGTTTTYYNNNIWESDARVYTTALSAEDIAELYHSAVIVDNTGKNYAYEYFEA